jgi:hypothetical protein
MKRLVPIAALLVVVLFAIEQAGAIPAFARKYNMSCNTCHQPIPRLKPYGDDFARNGFQLEGNEPPRAFRETGDEDLLLMRELPLAIRLEGYARWLPEEEVGTDRAEHLLLLLLPPR